MLPAGALRPDRCAESVLAVVGPPHRLLFGRELGHAHHRTEDLLLHASRVVTESGDDCGAEEVTILEAGGELQGRRVRGLPTKYLAAVLHRVAHVTPDFLEVLFAVQGPHEHILFFGIAHFACVAFGVSPQSIWP